MTRLHASYILMLLPSLACNRDAVPSSAASLPGDGFEHAAVDLGEHRWHTTIDAELHFRNGRREPVTIADIVTSCGCTLVEGAAALRGHALPPNGDVVIPLTVSAGEHPGRKEVWVYLTLESGDRYSTLLYANILCDWSLSREAVDFGRIDITQPSATPPVQTVDFLSDKCNLVAATVDSSVQWLSVIADGGTIKLAIQPSQLPPGQATVGVSVLSDNEVLPIRKILVHAVGVAGLRAFPSHAVMRLGKDALFQFMSPEQERAELVSVQSPSDAIVADIMNDGQLRVRVHRYIDATTLTVMDRYGRTGVVMVSMLQ